MILEVSLSRFGCCNKTPQNEWLIRKRNVLPQFRRPGRLRWSCQSNHVWMKTLFLFMACAFLLCPLQVEGGRSWVWTPPIMRTPPPRPNHPQMSHLKTLFPLAFEFQHVTLGWEAGTLPFRPFRPSQVDNVIIPFNKWGNWGTVKSNNWLRHWVARRDFHIQLVDCFPCGCR